MTRIIVLILFSITYSACQNINHAPSIKAKQTRTQVSMVSEMFVSVEIEFSNTTKRLCKVKEYEVRWNSGKFIAEPDDFPIAANQTVVRTARINPDSGNLKELHTNGDIVVEIVEADCEKQ